MPGGSAGAIRAGKAYYELSADRGPLDKGLKQAEALVKASVAAAGSKLKAISASLGSALTSPLAALAAAAVPATALHVFAGLGEELTDTSRRTGASAEALARLDYAAKQTGSSLGAVEGVLTTVRDKLFEAQRGSEDAQIAFMRLGLNFLKLSQMKPDERLRAIADRLNAIQNPALKAAMAMDVLGTTDILPLITRLREMEARAQRLGITMSNDDAQAAKRFGQALADLHANMQATATVIGARIAPALTDLINKWIGASSHTRQWIRANTDAFGSADALWAGIKLLWAKGSAFVAEKWDTTIQGLQEKWINASAMIAKGWIVFGHVFSGVIEFMRNAIIGTMEAIGAMAKVLEATARGMGKLFALIAPEIGKAFKDLADKLQALGLKDIAKKMQAGMAGLLDLDNPELKKKLDAIEKERLAKLKEVQANAPPGGDPAAIAKLQAEFDAAVAEAKRRAGEKHAPDAEVAAFGKGAPAGMGGAIFHVKGVGAHDVRSKEGFAALMDTLKMANNPMLGILRQQLDLDRRNQVDVHQIRLKTDKIGLVGL